MGMTERGREVFVDEMSFKLMSDDGEWLYFGGKWREDQTLVSLKIQFGTLSDGFKNCCYEQTNSSAHTHLPVRRQWVTLKQTQNPHSSSMKWTSKFLPMCICDMSEFITSLSAVGGVLPQ